MGTGVFDYKDYWVKRLKTSGSDLRGVGHKRFSPAANKLMYLKAQEELAKALKVLRINIEGETVLDAGAGIGEYVNFYLQNGAKVFAVDISKDALNILKKRYPSVQIKQVGLENLDIILKRKKFYLVHCFDVLYHIMDKDDLKKALQNLCKLSQRYVVIHDAPRYWGKGLDFLFRREHIDISKVSVVKQMNKMGFKQIGYFPTHILYARPPFSLISGSVPYPMYFLDKFLIRAVGLKGFETNCIRVFEKKRYG